MSTVQTYYLKLVGVDTYASKTVGSLTRGQVISVTDKAIAERLMAKVSGLAADGEPKFTFEQVEKGQIGRKPTDRKNRLSDALAEKSESPAGNLGENSGEGSLEVKPDDKGTYGDVGGEAETDGEEPDEAETDDKTEGAKTAKAPRAPRTKK